MVFGQVIAQELPPAYVGIYGLNQDSNLLNVLSGTYGINYINGGFLFLNKNEPCSFDNLTDGSGVHPVTGHTNEYQEYINNGGKIGFTISGADSGEANVWDPIRRCSQAELETLMLDIIESSPVTVSNLSVDLESESGDGAWQDGLFSKEAYDKIGLSLEKVKSLHPNVKTDLTFPAYSDYWKQGYTSTLKNFLSTYDGSLDYIVIMSNTDHNSTSTLSSRIENSLTFLNSWSRNKTYSLLFHDSAGKNFTAEELESVTVDLGISGFTTLTTSAEFLATENADLYRNLYNSNYVPIEPADNLTVNIVNSSLSTGVDVSFVDSAGSVLMNAGYLAPSADVTYQDNNNYTNTSELVGSSNVIVKFNTWVSTETCPNSIDFDNDYKVVINVINPSEHSFSCTFTPIN